MKLIADNEWLFDQLRSQKPTVLLYIVATLASLGVFMLLPVWASTFVDQLQPGADLSRLSMQIGIGVAIYFASAIVSLFRSKVTSVLVNKVILEMRMRVFAHLLSISPRQSKSAKTDNLISGVSNDVQMYHSALSNIVSVLIPSVILAVAFVLAMLRYSPILFGCVLLLIGPIVLVTMYFSKFIYAMAHESQAALAQIIRKFAEVIAGAREIKAFGQEPQFIQAFAKANRHNFDIQVRRDQFDAVHPIAIGVTTAVGIALLLFLSVFLVDRQMVALNNLTAFMTCAVLAYGPAQQASFAATRVIQFKVVMERLSTILDMPSEKIGHFAPACSPEGSTVQFRNVNFAYEGGNLLFRDFNLDIPAGQMVALVGPSGAGKSTLVDFIPGFLAPQSGQVLVDGVDIRDWSLKHLRDRIGIVSQEPFLVEGTLAQNLQFGSPDVLRAKVEEAARSAHVAEFADKLADGYESVVEFGGRNFSVGQRQRIALARVLLKGPGILLLDEPTSALDGYSERLVREAIHAAGSGRTVLIVAHRLTTVQSVDRILVLKNGLIIEDGTHEQLYRRDGTYRSLYDSQFGAVAASV